MTQQLPDNPERVNTAEKTYLQKFSEFLKTNPQEKDGNIQYIVTGSGATYLLKHAKEISLVALKDQEGNIFHERKKGDKISLDVMGIVRDSTKEQVKSFPFNREAHDIDIVICDSEFDYKYMGLEIRIDTTLTSQSKDNSFNSYFKIKVETENGEELEVIVSSLEAQIVNKLKHVKEQFFKTDENAKPLDKYLPEAERYLAWAEKQWGEEVAYLLFDLAYSFTQDSRLIGFPTDETLNGFPKHKKYLDKFIGDNSNLCYVDGVVLKKDDPALVCKEGLVTVSKLSFIMYLQEFYPYVDVGEIMDISRNFDSPSFPSYKGIYSSARQMFFHALEGVVYSKNNNRFETPVIDYWLEYIKATKDVPTRIYPFVNSYKALEVFELVERYKPEDVKFDEYSGITLLRVMAGQSNNVNSDFLYPAIEFLLNNDPQYLKDIEEGLKRHQELDGAFGEEEKRIRNEVKDLVGDVIQRSRKLKVEMNWKD